MSCGNRFECALRKNSRLSTQSNNTKEAYGKPKEAYGKPKEAYGKPKEACGKLKEACGKPSNLELYNENQKRLSDLMKAREEIDNHFFRPISSGPLESQKVNTQTTDCLLKENIIVDDVELNNSLTTKDIFTPWVVPSTKNYSTN
jgi:hypothetical protein